MARKTTPKAISEQASRRALDLLRSRAADIGQAAVLRHRIDELGAEFIAVTEEYTAMLAKLRGAGWSDTELDQLGLTEVRTPKQATGRRRPTGPGVPQPRTPGDDRQDLAAYPSDGGDREV